MGGNGDGSRFSGVIVGRVGFFSYIRGVCGKGRYYGGGGRSRFLTSIGCPFGGSKNSPGKGTGVEGSSWIPINCPSVFGSFGGKRLGCFPRHWTNPGLFDRLIFEGVNGDGSN